MLPRKSGTAPTATTSFSRGQETAGHLPVLRDVRAKVQGRDATGQGRDSGGDGGGTGGVGVGGGVRGEGGARTKDAAAQVPSDIPEEEEEGRTEREGRRGRGGGGGGEGRGNLKKAREGVWGEESSYHWI